MNVILHIQVKVTASGKRANVDHEQYAYSDEKLLLRIDTDRLIDKLKGGFPPDFVVTGYKEEANYIRNIEVTDIKVL